MASLSLPAAELLNVLVSTFFYGIYLVSLGITGRILLSVSGRWKHRSEINWVVLCVCVLLFANTTLYHSLTTYMGFRAFVSYTGPGGAEHVFSTHNWEDVAKTFCVILQTLAGDAILIYRCWFLWRGPCVVIAPMLLWLANLVGGIGVMIIRSRSSLIIASPDLVPWGQSFWALTLCDNLIATSLIVWRIWRVERLGKKSRASQDMTGDERESPLSCVMRNIIETGMIYTTAAILMFAAFTTHSTLTYPASALVSAMMGSTAAAW
ncbi:hypothetical protein C8R43DRAFT_1122420 [Mycena crocata]|nr:hypothetical protein C8R43DRAFT_1122420 [Mycena crocata]